MFFYLDIVLVFIFSKIIVERDFHKVGVEKNQVILFSIICDITGCRAPILFLQELIIRTVSKPVMINKARLLFMEKNIVKNKNSRPYYGQSLCITD